jgi:hypothetical protein
MSEMNTNQSQAEKFFNNTFEIGRREAFEVNDEYCYFDYSHEELLAAVLCGREVAVGTLVTEHEVAGAELLFQMREAAAIVDPKIGVWIVAKMFDGFDFEEWDRTNSYRDDILAELEVESTDGELPIWIAALVLGVKREDLIIPEAYADVVFGEDEVTQVYDRLSAQHRPDAEAATVCRGLLEIADFIDAKDASDIREIPSWLDECLS